MNQPSSNQSSEERGPRPITLINYVIYAVLMSIFFVGNIFSSADELGLLAFDSVYFFIFACFALRWNRQDWTLSRQPIKWKSPLKWKTPKLVDLIGVASALLLFAALFLFLSSVDRHFWYEFWYKYFSNNKPLMACLWGFYLLFPLREMLSRSDEPANKFTEPNAAPNAGSATPSGNSGATEGPPSVN